MLTFGSLSNSDYLGIFTKMHQFSTVLILILKDLCIEIAPNSFTPRVVSRVVRRVAAQICSGAEQSHP